MCLRLQVRPAIGWPTRRIRFLLSKLLLQAQHAGLVNHETPSMGGLPVRSSQCWYCVSPGLRANPL